MPQKKQVHNNTNKNTLFNSSNNFSMNQTKKTKTTIEHKTQSKKSMKQTIHCIFVCHSLPKTTAVVADVCQ